MTRPPLARPRAPKRLAAAALSLALVLPACGQGGFGGADMAGLTPQQQTLRRQAQNWNQTVATGALAGGALGAGVGALAGGKNRAQSALIGGLLGAAAGSAAGYFVANRNLAFENRELQAGQRIEAAQQVAQNLNNTAAASEQVVADNRRKLAEFDRQYRAGQMTAAQYQAQTEAMRGDVEVMRKTAAEAQNARERLAASSQDVPQLASQGAKIDSAQRRLEASANALDAALRKVPTG